MEPASQADNIIQDTNNEEFVENAAKQLAGMVFDLWLEHVDELEQSKLKE